MARWDQATDEALLLASSAQAEAFSEFYRRHVDGMLVFFAHRTRDAEVALDLTAEVFAAALESSGRYAVSAAPAAAWLYGIARHKLLDSIRRHRVDDSARRRLGMAPLEVTDERLEAIETRISHADVERAFAALPPSQRQALAARIIDERDYRDIARELRCSELVVRKRVSRSLKILRDQIKEPG